MTKEEYFNKYYSDTGFSFEEFNRRFEIKPCDCGGLNCIGTILVDTYRVETVVAQFETPDPEIKIRVETTSTFDGERLVKTCVTKFQEIYGFAPKVR